MTFPNMDGVPATNVYEEHVFKIIATFGLSSAVTYQSKDCSIAKTTTTTFTVTLPQAYQYITDFHFAWFAVATVANLTLKLTTNNVATDGTLVFTTEVAAGTATAPATGDVLYLTIGASQSDLNTRFTG